MQWWLRKDTALRWWLWLCGLLWLFRNFHHAAFLFVVLVSGALHLLLKKNRSIALGVLPAAVAIFSNCRFRRGSATIRL
jgi:hypothetical protein